MTMTTSQFINSNLRFVTLKTDVANRRVVTVTGRIGTIGRTITRKLASNAAVRLLARQITAQKLRAGFVRIA